MQAQGENPWGAVFRRLPSWSNRHLYPGGWNDPKIQGALATALARDPLNGREWFDERYGGIPRKSRGIVFDRFRRATHCPPGVEFDETREVYLAVDPGYSPSSYAVNWVQIVGEEIRVFDEIYVNEMTHKEVLVLVRNHRAWPNVRHVVMDVAGQAHSGAGESAFEAWRANFADIEADFRPVITGQYVHVSVRNSRIHDKLSVNPLTGRPFMVFNARSCPNTIFEFEKGYKKSVHKVSGLVTSDDPKKEHDHAVAALGYLIVDRYSTADIAPLQPMKSQRVRHSYDYAFRRARR